MDMLRSGDCRENMMWNSDMVWGGDVMMWGDDDVMCCSWTVGLFNYWTVELLLLLWNDDDLSDDVKCWSLRSPATPYSSANMSFETSC